MRVSPEKTEIAKMRIAAKLLQKEVAGGCNVSARHLREVELGKRQSASLVERAMRFIGSQRH